MCEHPDSEDLKCEIASRLGALALTCYTSVRERSTGSERRATLAVTYVYMCTPSPDMKTGPERLNVDSDQRALKNLPKP